MKNAKRNLALTLSLLLLCTAFSAVGAAAESTNLIYNGSLDEEDWYYTGGPYGWTPGRTDDTEWLESVEEIESGTAYIYHKTGGVNNSPYVEIDALTYKSGDGEPKITMTDAWIPISGDTWYNLSFHHKKPDASILTRTVPQITLTFANGEGTHSGGCKPSTGVLFYNYESEKWVKYQLRFKAPAWAARMMVVFAVEYQKCASFDEISLVEDTTYVEYLDGTPLGHTGDAISAWPNTSNISFANPEGETVYMPIAFMNARTPITERPADGLMKAVFFYNAVNSTENVTCISAVYKKTAAGTTLVNCYIDEMTRAAEVNHLEQEITMPEAAEGEEYTVKSYIWSSTSGLKPVGTSNSFSY